MGSKHNSPGGLPIPEAIRSYGLDDDLLRCAAAYERAAHLCDRTLTSSSTLHAA